MRLRMIVASLFVLLLVERGWSRDFSISDADYLLFDSCASFEHKEDCPEMQCSWSAGSCHDVAGDSIEISSDTSSYYTDCSFLVPLGNCVQSNPYPVKTERGVCRLKRKRYDNLTALTVVEIDLDAFSSFSVSYFPTDKSPHAVRYFGKDKPPQPNGRTTYRKGQFTGQASHFKACDSMPRKTRDYLYHESSAVCEPEDMIWSPEECGEAAASLRYGGAQYDPQVHGLCFEYCGWFSTDRNLGFSRGGCAVAFLADRQAAYFRVKNASWVEYLKDFIFRNSYKSICRVRKSCAGTFKTQSGLQVPYSLEDGQSSENLCPHNGTLKLSCKSRAVNVVGNTTCDMAHRGCRGYFKSITGLQIFFNLTEDEFSSNLCPCDGRLHLHCRKGDVKTHGPVSCNCTFHTRFRAPCESGSVSYGLCPFQLDTIYCFYWDGMHLSTISRTPLLYRSICPGGCSGFFRTHNGLHLRYDLPEGSLSQNLCPYYGSVILHCREGVARLVGDGICNASFSIDYSGSCSRFKPIESLQDCMSAGRTLQIESAPELMNWTAWTSGPSHCFLWKFRLIYNIAGRTLQSPVLCVSACSGTYTTKHGLTVQYSLSEGSVSENLCPGHGTIQLQCRGGEISSVGNDDCLSTAGILASCTSHIGDADSAVDSLGQCISTAQHMGLLRSTNTRVIHMSNQWSNSPVTAPFGCWVDDHGMVRFVGSSNIKANYRPDRLHVCRSICNGSLKSTDGALLPYSIVGGSVEDLCLGHGRFVVRCPITGGDAVIVSDSCKFQQLYRKRNSARCGLFGAGRIASAEKCTSAAKMLLGPHVKVSKIFNPWFPPGCFVVTNAVHGNLASWNGYYEFVSALPKDFLGIAICSSHTWADSFLAGVNNEKLWLALLGAPMMGWFVSYVRNRFQSRKQRTYAGVPLRAPVREHRLPSRGARLLAARALITGRPCAIGLCYWMRVGALAWVVSLATLSYIALTPLVLATIVFLLGVPASISTCKFGWILKPWQLYSAVSWSFVKLHLQQNPRIAATQFAITTVFNFYIWDVFASRMFASRVLPLPQELMKNVKFGTVLGARSEVKLDFGIVQTDVSAVIGGFASVISSVAIVYGLFHLVVSWLLLVNLILSAFVATDVDPEVLSCAQWFVSATDVDPELQSLAQRIDDAGSPEAISQITTSDGINVKPEVAWTSWGGIPYGGLAFTMWSIRFDLLLDANMVWNMLKSEDYFFAFGLNTCWWYSFFQEYDTLLFLEAEVKRCIDKGLQSSRFLQVQDNERGFEAALSLIVTTLALPYTMIDWSSTVTGLISVIWSMYQMTKYTFEMLDLGAEEFDDEDIDDFDDATSEQTDEILDLSSEESDAEDDNDDIDDATSEETYTSSAVTHESSMHGSSQSADSDEHILEQSSMASMHNELPEQR